MNEQQLRTEIENLHGEVAQWMGERNDLVAALIGSSRRQDAERMSTSKALELIADLKEAADNPSWVEGPPTERGTFACRSNMDAVPRLWVAIVHNSPDSELMVNATLVHQFNTGMVKLASLAWFSEFYRITHHLKIDVLSE